MIYNQIVTWTAFAILAMFKISTLLRDRRMAHFWPSLTIAKKIQFQYLFLKFDDWKKLSFRILTSTVSSLRDPETVRGRRKRMRIFNRKLNRSSSILKKFKI